MFTTQSAGNQAISASRSVVVVVADALATSAFSTRALLMRTFFLVVTLTADHAPAITSFVHQ